METVEDHPIHTSTDVVKPNIVEDASADESNVCQKSNGVECDVQVEGEHSEANNVLREVDKVPPETDNVPPEPLNEPEKVESEPAKPDSEPAKPNSDPAVPDSDPVKLDSEPDPVKLDSEPAKSDLERNVSEVESKPENLNVSDHVEAEAESGAEPEIPIDHDSIATDIATDEPDSNIGIEVQQDNEMIHTDEVLHDVITETIIESEKEICIEEGISSETMVEIESSISTVQFETEVVVEENDYDGTEKLLVDNQESDHTNNILNELGPNIELSEVLRSSDISENIVNNNSAIKQEIFNKEELLDILEGNDNIEQPINIITESSPQTPSKVLVAEIAMQQLSRLSKKRGDSRASKIKKEKTKSPLKSSNNRNLEKGKQQQALLAGIKQDINADASHQKDQSDNSEQKSQLNTTEKEALMAANQQTHIDNEQQEASGTCQEETQYTDNIVKSLVMDWEDEPAENNEVNEIIKEGDSLIKDSEELKNSQECMISKDETIESTNTGSPSSDSQTKLSKTDDDAPTRRLSRVIKKKVIFDPDNPDTFTKGKSNKAKETPTTKEQTPSKKGKSDQSVKRSKSKSPLSTLQWKKPTSGSNKNSKQHKRLSEVDRLLMDEGAVNMIYQLTPEAPKGKKNVRTKAEFIKKIQSSSTPDTKEMKFRERKKELKYEEGEAKKILGGKHRTSLSSSVKSPAVSEDFETHSADDSIIYRRHSSSSYSSSCMSPRRLSDVEAGNAQPQSATQITQQPVPELETNPNLPVNEEIVFKSDSPKISSSEMINKNDCLSIKEKLNSKLSLALNKRKRENSKNEKPAKQKKIVKTDENIIPPIEEDNKLNQLKFISVTIDQRLALICIKKTGLKICVEILKELEEALKYIDNRQDISITLLESQCGTLCSSLDLSLLLDENKEVRANHAYELAESVRSLLAAAARHRALLCCGVWGAAAGVALALVAMSDVALASEGASFWLAAAAAPATPGAAALTARCRPLPQALVNDLVIFGRRLSASEALQGGLISRVLWPDRFDEQVRDIAKDIAAQPLQTILLKKKLLSLKTNSEAELTFLACLETERDLLVEYWTSVEGQELLRATLDAA
ncbi:protein SCAF11 [Maniola jurtina]|uniref:protein SCAF11 n=1 Tax=Maniola jurtina TaxID=191418 RepID=UPI001E688F47|nr:protein SCAF11 [Maniola jurtina]